MHNPKFSNVHTPFPHRKLGPGGIAGLWAKYNETAHCNMVCAPYLIVNRAPGYRTQEAANANVCGQVSCDDGLKEQP